MLKRMIPLSVSGSSSWLSRSSQLIKTTCVLQGRPGQRARKIATTPTESSVSNEENGNHASFSSSSSSSSPLRVPDPTWSIASLELDRQHAPISRQELEILAKRALLDLGPLPVDQLCQDLGNLLHMMEKVQLDADHANQQEQDNDDLSSSLDELAIYDIPKGVAKAPLRDDTVDPEEDKEAKQVWNSLLKPKTTAVGGHAYFVIATQEETITTKE